MLILILLLTGCAALPSTYSSHVKISGSIGSIDSMEAEISQTVTLPGAFPQSYRGRFRARKDGALRIDYSFPEKHTLIIYKNRIIWYYPLKGLVQYSEPGPGSSLDQEASVSARVLMPRLKELPQGALYLGRGRVSLFTPAQVYQTAMAEGASARLWVDPETGALLKRAEYASDSSETRLELYSEYTRVSGLPVPGRIEVILRADKGRVRSLTRYSSVVLNREMADTVFNPEVPAGVRAVRSGADQ